MFNQPRYLLSDPDQAPVLVGTCRGLKSRLVMARHLCLSFQLDARGVPWHQTAAFVTLQGKRQAPFSDTAGAYLRQGDVVHVWAWSAAIQHAALARLGKDAQRAEVVPESLLGPVIAEGALFRDCVVGVEGLRFERGSLMASTWWPQPPGVAARSEWAGAVSCIDESRTAVQRAAAGRLWPRRWRALLPLLPADTPDHTAWRIGRHAVLLAGLAALSVSTAMMGYAFREQQLLQAALDTAQQSLEAAMQRRSARVVNPIAAVSAPTEDGYWQRAQAATRALQFERVWANLARSFGGSGYVLRDFSYERDEVRLTLVSAYGGDLDLDKAIVTLESSGLWLRVDIIDFSNAAAVRLGAKPRGELFAVRGQ